MAAEIAVCDVEILLMMLGVERCLGAEGIDIIKKFTHITKLVDGLRQTSKTY